MKHLIAVLFCFCSSSTALAEKNKVGDEDFCAVLGSLAAQIMQVRQNGTPMSELMKVAASQSDISEMMRAMVIAAYEVPQFSIEKNRQREINSFQNAVMLECYR